MGFVSQGSRGHTSSKGNASGTEATLSLSPSQTIPIGRLVVVWFAGDSIHQAGGDDGDPLNYRMKCQDSVGNIYTTVAGGSDGGDNIYAQTAIFVTFTRFAIGTSDSITVTEMVITSGQVAPRAMSIEEFSYDVDKQWAVTDEGAQKITNRATDPGAISRVSGQSGREYLWLHSLGAEGPNSDTYTWDSDYTQIAGDGTTGGADDSNIHLRGGWRIATITSDTVDVTAGTPTRDYTQVMVKLTLVDGAPDGAFPTVPGLLDDFNRADEDPLGTALLNWDTGNCGPRSNGANPAHMEVSSNQAKCDSSSTIGGSWYSTTWAALAAGDWFEAFVTVPVIGNVVLHMRGTGCAETATVDGIAMGYFNTASPGFAPRLEFGSSGNQGAVDQLRARTWLSFSAGWKIGMQMRRVASSPAENVVYYWVDRGNGFEVFLAIHALQALSGYTGATGKIGLEVLDATVRLDDLGGGPALAVLPQIYRYALDSHYMLA